MDLNKELVWQVVPFKDLNKELVWEVVVRTFDTGNVEKHLVRFLCVDLLTFVFFCGC